MLNLNTHVVGSISLRYHVLVDPPGPKIGSGGSTLVVLDALSKAYGAHFKTMKILLLHAGGYSKRLPHVSACGKIFATLPIGVFVGDATFAMAAQPNLTGHFAEREHCG